MLRSPANFSEKKATGGSCRTLDPPDPPTLRVTFTVR